MSITSLENELVFYLRLQLKKPITKNWIQEWSTSKEQVEKNKREDEELIELKYPGMHCWIALKKPDSKPKKANP